MKRSKNKFLLLLLSHSTVLNYLLIRFRFRFRFGTAAIFFFRQNRIRFYCHTGRGEQPMPPTSDGCVRTVGCALVKLIPNAEHRSQLSTSNAGRESDQDDDGGGGGLSPRTNVPRLQ